MRMTVRQAADHLYVRRPATETGYVSAGDVSHELTAAARAMLLERPPAASGAERVMFVAAAVWLTASRKDKQIEAARIWEEWEDEEAEYLHQLYRLAEDRVERIVKSAAARDFCLTESDEEHLRWLIVAAPAEIRAWVKAGLSEADEG